MRTKTLTFIAISALALVGCGAAEQTQNIAVTPSETVEASASAPAPEESQPVDSVEVAEEKFVNYANSRSIVHSAPEPAREKVVEALHEYCESGKPIEASSVESLNENLEHGADTDFCEPLEAK